MNKGLLTLLTLALLLFSAPGCGGGGSTSSPPPAFDQLVLNVGAGAASSSFGDIAVYVQADGSRPEGTITFRRYPSPFFPTNANVPFARGIGLVADPSLITDKGINLTLTVGQESPTEEWFVLFGKDVATGGATASFERTSPNTVDIHISKEQYEEHSISEFRGTEKGLFISAAQLKRPYDPRLRIPQLVFFEKISLNTKFRDANESDSLAGDSVAIIIHGLNNSANDMLDLGSIVDELQIRGNDAYDQIWFYEYPDNADSIQENAASLARLLNEHGISDAKRVDFYGHSMGGLVARWAIEKEGIGEFVQRLFMFGTPNKGVPLEVAKLGYIVPGIRNLHANDSFIQELNHKNSPYEETILYCAIAGTSYNYLIRIGLHDHKVGEICKYLYQAMGYNGPIDGIVSVESAIPKDLNRFGKTSFTYTGEGIVSGSTVRSLNLNHTDVGGSHILLVDIQQMLSSSGTAIGK